MQGPLVAVPFFRIFATVKTMHLRLKQCLAAFMLAVLLAAHAGQKVHIYLEDHAHFAAFSGDLVPDNGAAEQVVEFCVVDDFYFFPYRRRPSLRMNSTPRCWPCCNPKPRAANVRSRSGVSPCGRLRRRNCVS